MTPDERIAAALRIAASYGQIDGSYHKMWTIDQMVRALTDCPMVERTAIDSRGKPYTYTTMDESGAYKQFIMDYCAGENGANTYDWDTGITP